MPRDTSPPYQRIVDSIRGRIESGDLGPGDRVPSTRAIARKWGVALATAAHALNTLAAKGWVHSVPRVGSVVARTAPTPGAPRADASLSRAAIVECAIAMADREGLPSLSLRGVAARLAAPVTSLYRHVDSKEDLLRAMSDAALSEESLPAHPPKGWRPQIELAARAHWQILRRHPWLARVMYISRPRPLAKAIAHADWILRALDGHGLNASRRMDLHVILHAFIQGMAVNLEAEAEAASETGMSDVAWMDTQLEAFTALARTGRYPSFAAALDELDAGFELDMDALFELGLTSMLDGFARLLDRRAPTR
jgi:DNA-binding transcriptional regulator YhcF (GntR family)